MEARYVAKSAELAVTDRTIKRWVRAYRQLGVAGLVNETGDQPTATDNRWIETALEVMVEHTDQSRPSQTMVIERTNARVVARFGEGRGGAAVASALSAPRQTRETLSDVPVEHEAQPRHR